MENQKNEIFFIDNGILKVSAGLFGGELLSIESYDGIDYLWRGDPEFWGSRSPILFPIVGALRDSKAKSALGDIEMPPHGIVRKKFWQLDSHSDTEMTFKIESDEESRKAFPFDFILYVTYSLAGNALEMTFTVKNPSAHALPYCVGGHPAFNVPLVQGEAFDDYYIAFEKEETADCEMVDTSVKLIDDTRGNRLLTNSKTFGLNHVLFRGDALVFSQLKSRSVKMVSSKSGHGVGMDFTGMDYFAVWTQAKDSPFVCLEPWTGTATTVSEDDVFERKRGMKLLLPQTQEETSFTMTFF